MHANAIRIVSLAAALLSLAGCGGGRETQAAQACEREVKTKLAGRTYELNAADLAAHAAAEGADTLHLTSAMVFDKGLASEYKQTLDCRVRFEAGKDPTVIFLQFNWNMDDLNKK